ncbi:Ribbon-helix-helix domain-containing protein [Bacillus sp. 491mf]|uniref:ribbon-helix-helix domain-containing protein n=1 Tax=Bacillus TaxID=1386 RepID=UPI0005501004|nr:MULTISPECIES: ribbon-helix-helix domain-containing protein [unclassified Bacillus (in: firmicutes)]SFB89398.1 Ribbon-helix-helix domain-containing protein [Bacillus sp. 491mf]
MDIGEIIDRLNNHESIAMVAKRLEMSPYTLSKKLRLLGYEYDSGQKKRMFVGEGEEPRHLQLKEAASIQREKIDYQRLIYEQLQSIYKLLQKQEYGMCITSVQTGEKKRRTFSLSKQTLEQLDCFSIRNGVHKSKVVEVALEEYLKRYREKE